jgi:organic radical activating enzyme
MSTIGVKLIPINERFISVQGEGKYTGRLSYFVRMQGCNLKCNWCDTKYALEGKSNEKLKVQELAHILWKSINDGDVYGIVLTGGEPLLYVDQLKEVTRRVLISAPVTAQDVVEIETNGLRLDTHDWRDYPWRQILWNISPKLPSSHEKSIEQMGTKQIIAIKERLNYIFKFVIKVGDIKSIQEVYDFIGLHGIPHEKVWVMPQSLGRDDQLGGLAEFADWAIRHKFNISLRMQNIIWDGKRGV